ncbi:MAG: radical SAM protein, partial [Candidatus Schekmanbacteria bacterium]
MLKNIIKRSIPPKLLPFARFLYRMKSVPRYWIPYAFLDGKAFKPISLHYEITFRCNQRCAMCPQQKEKESEDSKIMTAIKCNKELEKEEIYKLADDAEEAGIKEFTITGGEPFIRKDIIDILSYCSKKSFSLGLLSNGTLIDDEKAEKLVSLGVNNLQVSIEAGEEIHNKIRNQPNAFKLLLKALDRVNYEKEKQRKSKPIITFCCTISSLNAPYLSTLLDIAERYEAEVNYGYLFYSTEEMDRKTNEIYNMGHSKEESQDISDELKRVDVEALSREIDKIYEISEKKKIPVRFSPPLKGDEIPKRFSDDSFAYAYKCFYPWYAVRVNPYGDVYPCSMNITMGNIKDER